MYIELTLPFHLTVAFHLCFYQTTEAESRNFNEKKIQVQTNLKRVSHYDNIHLTMSWLNISWELPD